MDHPTRSWPALTALLSALLAAAGLLWILGLESGPRPAVDGLGETAAEEAPAEEPDPPDTGPERFERKSAPDPGPELRPPIQPTDLAAGALRLRVVDEELKIVARARVQWCDLLGVPDAELERTAAQWRSDPEAWMERRGELAWTDENGELTLPVSLRGMRIVARNGALLGDCETAPGEQRTRTVILFPDQALSIHTVDSQGRPVEGIPVGIYADGLIWKGETQGPAARATPHIDEVQLVGVQPHAVALLLADPLIAVAFRSDPLPRRPLRLVIPETGSVAFEALGPGGAPLRDRTLVRLLLDSEHPVDSLHLDKAFLVELANGRGRLDRVGLGLALRARLTLPDAKLKLSEQFTGPRHPGEVINLQLRMGGVLLEGRAVDGEFEPIPEHPLVLRWPGGERWIGTDAEGRLQILFDAQVATHEDFSIELDLKERCTPAKREHLTLGGTQLKVDLAHTHLEGRVDLGDLVFERQPILAAGKVVDTAGSPVAGASLRMSYRPPVQGPREFEGIYGRSFPDGGFLLRGTPGAMSIHIRATKSPLDASIGPLAPGSMDLRVVLLPPGRLEGRLILPQVLSAQELDLSLFRGPDRISWGSPAEDGTFQFENLSEGSYELQVRHGPRNRQRALVTAVTQIEVVSEQTCRDPRLDPLSLVGRVKYVQLRLRTSAGQSRFTVRLFSDGVRSEELGEADSDADGRVSALLSSEHDTFWILTKNHRPRRIAWTPGEREVHLDSSSDVRVSFPPGLALPDIHYTLRVHLESELLPPGLAEHCRAYCIFRGGRPIAEERSIRALWTGRHRLLLRLTHRGEGKSLSHSLRTEAIHIEDRPGIQRILIPLSQAELDAGVKALRQERARNR